MASASWLRSWRVATLLLVELSLSGAVAPAHAVSPASSDGANRLAGSISAAVGGDHHRAADYGHLPLSFEANQGQAEAAVDFVAHGNGYTLLLSSDAETLSVRQPPTSSAGAATLPTAGPSETGAAKPSSMLQVQLVGADPHAQVLGQQSLPGVVNYFIGDDPSQWHVGIPTYASVQYQQIYPGIDLTYYGNQGQLEDDFVLASGADPRAIRLAFSGADQVQLGGTGALIVQVGGAEFRQAPPVLYQDGPHGRQTVAGGYVMDGLGEVGFTVGAYDPTRPLIIDPVLVYSTYLGGSGTDGGLGIAVDAAGSAYVTGFTQSSDFPTTPGAFERTSTGSDVFVSKLNPTGTALVYSTFLGGLGNIFIGALRFGIAVDTAGNAYVIGATGSSDFPTTPGAFQQSLLGPLDAFVTKLNPTGTALVYSTYLGISDSGFEFSYGIAVDRAGNAYVTGRTGSSDFPTTPGAFQPVFGGGIFDAFVTKLNPAGTGLVYSTFLGGNDLDEGLGIAVDAAGDAYVTGLAGSSNFPTTPGAFQRTFHNGDAFVTKLNPTGTALVYSTLLGGTAVDSGFATTVDTAGNACVTGDTNSVDFPTTPGAFQRTLNGSNGDAFVTKLNPAGTALVYSTYLAPGEGFGIALDAAGHAYVTGRTGSSNFPTTPGAPQGTFQGETDAFATKLNTTGSALVYSTFLGGSGLDAGIGIAVDKTGNAYITGGTRSSNFPTTPGALQRTFRGGGEDAFVARIAPGPPGCAVTSLAAGPPSQLKVAIHADRGLSSVVVTQATNTSIALPSFVAGSTGTFTVTATKVDQSLKATFSLRVTDQTGAATTCDPALVTVGRETGDAPVQVLHHLASGESEVTITNGTPGVDRLRLVVNGRRFEVADLHDGEARTVDVSSAMRKGTDNTIIVISHGQRGSSAVVMIGDV